MCWRRPTGGTGLRRRRSERPHRRALHHREARALLGAFQHRAGDVEGEQGLAARGARIPSGRRLGDGGRVRRRADGDRAQEWSRRLGVTTGRRAEAAVLQQLLRLITLEVVAEPGDERRDPGVGRDRDEGELDGSRALTRRDRAQSLVGVRGVPCGDLCLRDDRSGWASSAATAARETVAAPERALPATAARSRASSSFAAAAPRARRPIVVRFGSGTRTGVDPVSRRAQPRSSPCRGARCGAGHRDDEARGGERLGGDRVLPESRRPGRAARGSR